MTTFVLSVAILVIIGVGVIIWSMCGLLDTRLSKILSGACVVLALALVIVTGDLVIRNRSASTASSSTTNSNGSFSEATYEYFDEQGWCVAGVCGTTDYDVEGGRKYIIDETVILGPFQDMPNLTIAVQDTDIEVTTEGLEISDDYSGEEGYNYAKERRFKCDGVYGGIAATLYSDGEIYLSVKFYRPEDSVTIDPRPDLDEAHNAARLERIVSETTRSGSRDYFLHPASDGDVITLAYDLDSLEVVE